MPVRIEVGGTEGSPDVEYTSKEHGLVDTVQPHTAVGDYEVEVPWDPDAADHEFKAVRIYRDGNIKFRGKLFDFDWNQNRNRTRLAGEGLADDLRQIDEEVRYQNIETYNAIADFWSTYTNFTATVQTPTITEVDTDSPVYSADSPTEFGNVTTDVADTVPAVQEAPGYVLADASFFSEAEDTQGGGDSVSDSAFSGGSGKSIADIGDDIEFDFTTDHVIPGQQVGFAIRFYVPSGAGHPAFDVEVDGDNVDAVAEDAFIEDDLGWFGAGSGGQLGSDLSAGQHTASLNVTSGTGDLQVDCLVVFDARYNYNFDNVVDGNGWLEGPQPKPDSVVFRFDQDRQPMNVTAIAAELDESNHNGIGKVEVSYDGGSTWVSLTSDWGSGDDRIKDDQPNNVGTTVDLRVEFERFGSRTTQSPTDGYLGGELDSVAVEYDGTDLSTIEDQTFRGSGLEILQDLHRKADFRFTIDHTARDGNGDLIKQVESYKGGSIKKSATFVVQNRKPSRSVRSGAYANYVTIRGALKDDGTRPVATVKSISEIQALGGNPLNTPPADGFRVYTATMDSLTTLSDVESEARSILFSKTNRDNKGVLEIKPKYVLPGYDYDVDWFDNGNVERSSNKQVEYHEEFGDASGTMTFSEPKALKVSVVELGYKQGVRRQSS